MNIANRRGEGGRGLRIVHAEGFTFCADAIEKADSSDKLRPRNDRYRWCSVRCFGVAAAAGEVLEKTVQEQTGVNYNPRSFAGSGRTRSILRFSAPIRVLWFFSSRRQRGKNGWNRQRGARGAVAVLRRRTLKVLERAAILVGAGFFAGTGTFADDTKPRQPDAPPTTAAKAAAGGSSAGDTTAKTAAGSDDSAAATGASDAAAAAAPVSSSAAAPASSSSSLPAPAALPKPNSGATKGNAATAADEDSEQPNFTPMPALDGNPGLFTLETGETLPKHGWSLGIGLNKFSRMPGDITSLQLIPSAGYGINRWFSVFFQINSYDYI